MSRRFFVKANSVLGPDDIARALTRMAHEILERHGGAEDLALAGIQRRGAPLAYRLAKQIHHIEDLAPPVAELDVSFYRDDIRIRRPKEIFSTNLEFGVDNLNVILVDDVLYTGRTIRAAIDALVDFGRPKTIELAVLIDRGHRELPIRADFVGKNIPTSKDQDVIVKLIETDGEDSVEVTS